MIKRASLLRLKNCIGTNLFCLANFNEDIPRNKISDLVYRENLTECRCSNGPTTERHSNHARLAFPFPREVERNGSTTS